MKTYTSISYLFYGVPVGIHGAVVPDVAGGSNGEYKQEKDEGESFEVVGCHTLHT